MCDALSTVRGKTFAGMDNRNGHRIMAEICFVNLPNIKEPSPTLRGHIRKRDPRSSPTEVTVVWHLFCCRRDMINEKRIRYVDMEKLQDFDNLIYISFCVTSCRYKINESRHLLFVFWQRFSHSIFTASIYVIRFCKITNKSKIAINL